jgi:hypothetical protein
MSDDEPSPTIEAKDLQWAAMLVRDGWMEHDELALAGLTPEQRQAQLDARMALYEFVDDYREAAKEREEHAVYHAPEWKVVAGMKDLLDGLLGTALAACMRDDEEADRRRDAEPPPDQ